MRMWMALVVLVAVGGCKSSKKPPEELPAAAPARENQNPYKNVMPAKVKQQVEDIQKKSEDKSDKLLENAK
jgi:predicted component of type VI protein secretion system